MHSRDEEDELLRLVNRLLDEGKEHSPSMAVTAAAIALGHMIYSASSTRAKAQRAFDRCIRAMREQIEADFEDDRKNLQ